MQIFCYNVDLGKSFPGLKFNVREGKIAHSYQSSAGIYTWQDDWSLCERFGISVANKLVKQATKL